MKENNKEGNSSISSSGLASPKKSLIPLPTTKHSERMPLTPVQSSKKAMPTTPTLNQTPKSKAKVSGKKLRNANLTPISSMLVSASPPRTNKPLEEKTKATANETNTSPVTEIAPTYSSTPIQSGALKERVDKFVDKEVQTDHPDIQLITGDEIPPSYWKDLAETRRVALEDALRENEELHQRIENLERENREMEYMLEDAKEMAKYISAMTEDSGIATDESVNVSNNQTGSSGSVGEREENSEGED